MSSVSITQPVPQERAEHFAWLARWPTIGWALVLVGALLTAILVVSVKTNGVLTALDAPIDNSLHAYALSCPPWLVMMWRAIETLGREVVQVAGVLLGLYWLWHRMWREFSMLAAGVLVGTPIFFATADLVGRHRPVFSYYIEYLPGPGFPSGHAMTAVLFYGLIAYLLLPHLKSRGWRILAFVDAILIALLVGFSRIFIGLHFPTDILGGYAIGLGWGALVYTAVEVNRWCKSR